MPSNTIDITSVAVPTQTPNPTPTTPTPTDDSLVTALQNLLDGNTTNNNANGETTILNDTFPEGTSGSDSTLNSVDLLAELGAGTTTEAAGANDLLNDLLNGGTNPAIDISEGNTTGEANGITPTATTTTTTTGGLNDLLSQLSNESVTTTTTDTSSDPLADFLANFPTENSTTNTNTNTTTNTSGVPSDLLLLNAVTDVSNPPASHSSFNIELGTTGQDTVAGTVNADAIYGLGDDDSLFGFEGNDRLAGGAGNDILVGGDGNDSLAGNAGRDKLTGGNGADRFILGPGQNDDWITDFQDGVDSLVISGYDASALKLIDVMSSTGNTGGTFVFFGDEEHSCTFVQGVSSAQLVDDIVIASA